MSFHVSRDVDLKPYNTMSLSSLAAYFAFADHQGDIGLAIDYAHDNHLPICVLGGGSNVIFADNFSGLVLLLRTKGIHIVEETVDDVLVEVAAGEVWDEFLQYCLQQKWYGLENLAIIPGTVGAAPIQNIGAYGQEVADCIESVNLVDCRSGQGRRLLRKDCHFAYRDSIFKHALNGQYIIISVTFRLRKIFKANLRYCALGDMLGRIVNVKAEDVRKAVIKIREAKLPSPFSIPNCGSFFKNPVVGSQQAGDLLSRYPAMPVYHQANGDIKLAAGWLIEHVGWKGKRLGAVGVYSEQALVLVNYADATYTELEQLIKAVKAAVYQQFGVDLEQEPVLIKAA